LSETPLLDGHFLLGVDANVVVYIVGLFHSLIRSSYMTSPTVPSPASS